MVVCFATPPYKPACFGMLCTPSRCGNFLHAPGMHSGYLPLNPRCSLLCRVCVCVFLLADLAGVPQAGGTPGVCADRSECDVLLASLDNDRRHGSTHHGCHAACCHRVLAG